MDKKDMIYGSRAIIESIEAGNGVERLFLQKGLKNELIHHLITLARQRDIATSFVPKEKLNKITRKNHQGAIAFLSLIGYASLANVIASIYDKGEDPLIVVLDRVTDVRNFGAIARSAECAGVHALVVPAKGAAMINSDAMKTSAGALHHIPVCRENSLKETLTYLKDSGLQLVAASEKGSQLYHEVVYQQPTALILGSEEDGITPGLLALVDQHVKIPQKGKIASLNVSVAAGIMIFEVLRSRMTSG